MRGKLPTVCVGGRGHCGGSDGRSGGVRSERGSGLDRRSRRHGPGRHRQGLRGGRLRRQQVATGEAALDAARDDAPGAVVLEVALGGDFSGYEVCRALRRAFGPDLPIVFLSGVRTESYDRVAGLLVGADDYLVKPYAADELLTRVRRLHPRPASGAAKLTKREDEVLRLLAEGLPQSTIAEQLFISSKTVGTHIEHILSKLGVQSRAQAVAVAYRDELVALAPLVRTWPRNEPKPRTQTRRRRRADRRVSAARESRFRTPEDLGGLGETGAVSPGSDGSPRGASSSRAHITDMGAPCVLASRRPAAPRRRGPFRQALLEPHDGLHDLSRVLHRVRHRLRRLLEA